MSKRIVTFHFFYITLHTVYRGMFVEVCSVDFFSEVMAKLAVFLKLGGGAHCRSDVDDLGENIE